MQEGTALRPLSPVANPSTRSGKYQRRSSCCDSLTRCALQLRRVHNRAAEEAIGAQAQRARRKPPSPYPLEIFRERLAASLARAAANIFWRDPEGGVCNALRTNPEIRLDHVPRNHSPGDRHR